MIVDDEEDLRDLIAEEFEAIGAQVRTASNGDEAFVELRKSPVDVLISDIRMPGGDGTELVKKVRANFSTPPIILFMTGFYISKQDEQVQDVDAIFTKPFDLREMLATVQRLVSKKKL
ncbi:MAG: response regulator [Bdellovibrionota bacterium]